MRARMKRALRRGLSWTCWTLAVVSGALTGAAFAGGGVGCVAGHRATCPPQTWVLVLGILVTVGFGVAGAVLYKPRRGPPPPRFPWEYRR